MEYYNGEIMLSLFNHRFLKQHIIENIGLIVINVIINLI